MLASLVLYPIEGDFVEWVNEDNTTIISEVMHVGGNNFQGRDVYSSNGYLENDYRESFAKIKLIFKEKTLEEIKDNYPHKFV